MNAGIGDGQLGVIAFGDSITNGGGELQWGVALQSWALWTARGLGLPYSPHAVDGALVTGVTEHQIPAYLRTTAHPGGRYDLGCLGIGTNDVRAPDWDAASFAAHLDDAIAFLADRCNEVLVLTIPVGMGRPPNRERIRAANDVIERCAARHGALTLDLRDFGARNLIMVDHIHPTAFGQIAIAERALERLAAGDGGIRIRVHPSELISYTTNRRQRLRGDATYIYRSLTENWRTWHRAVRTPPSRPAAARRAGR